MTQYYKCTECGYEYAGWGFYKDNKCWNCGKENDPLDQFVDIYSRMSKSMTCGNCKSTTRVDSPYSCKVCGRMLCKNCGEDDSLCEWHKETKNG